MHQKYARESTASSVMPQKKENYHPQKTRVNNSQDAYTTWQNSPPALEVGGPSHTVAGGKAQQKYMKQAN